MATVRRRDGFGDTTPNLRGDVERLQRALAKAGYEVEADGLFGAGTEKAVKHFQRQHDLEADGVVGPATWAALRPVLPARDRRPAFPRVSGFESFRGDLDWVHRREGHVGKPYWPGGSSGVTLDPGFDLGFQSREGTREFYGSLLSPEQVDALESVYRAKGDAANGKLKADPVLQSIRVSRSAAARIMPHVAVTYWRGIVKRFPRLASDETAASVQTALLSLAYNRGHRNRGLGVLRDAIARGDWLEVARGIGSMQQDHKLRGIRIRRRQEADLIRHELEFS